MNQENREKISFTIGKVKVSSNMCNWISLEIKKHYYLRKTHVLKKKKIKKSKTAETGVFMKLTPKQTVRVMVFQNLCFI